MIYLSHIIMKLYLAIRISHENARRSDYIQYINQLYIVGSQQWKYKAILSLFLFLNLVLTNYMIYGILNMSKDGRYTFSFLFVSYLLFTDLRFHNLQKRRLNPHARKVMGVFSWKMYCV